jgi:signal transduction histidine kinase
MAQLNGIIVQNDLQGPKLVRGDEQRLLPIFSNLFSNAIRCASAHGQVQVSAEIVGVSVAITICFNGVGIGASDLPDIFDRFHEGQPPSERNQRGFGLGLAIVKDLVALHGGPFGRKVQGRARVRPLPFDFPLLCRKWTASVPMPRYVA